MFMMKKLSSTCVTGLLTFFVQNLLYMASRWESKSIVESHGGKIWAENNNNGSDGTEGATFYFTLPIVNKDNS